jgi:hypothetical protein
MILIEFTANAAGSCVSFPSNLPCLKPRLTAPTAVMMTRVSAARLILQEVRQKLESPFREAGLNFRDTQARSLSQFCIEQRLTVGKIIVSQETDNMPMRDVQFKQPAFTSQEFCRLFVPRFRMQKKVPLRRRLSLCLV